MRVFLVFRGGFIIMFILGGLKLSVVVGGLFVIRFIYRSWIGISVLGIFRVVVRKML